VNVGDQDLAARLAAARRTVSLTSAQLDAITQRDGQPSVPSAAVSGATVRVRERSRQALQEKLDHSQTLLQELTEEHQHRLEHPEAAVPDTPAHTAAARAAVPDDERTSSGNQGRVRSADEPVRVAGPDIAAEEPTREPDLAPEIRPYAAVGDRTLAARIKATQARISVTSGQLDAMTQKDEERETPVRASVAKMQARARWALQRQLDGAQIELQEMTEEELRRTEHPELSVPDTATELRANIDQRRAHEPDVAVDHRGPAM
jgi:hypothetical protein